MLRVGLFAAILAGMGGIAAARPAPVSKPVDPTSKVKVVRLRDLLKEAIGLYQRSEFDAAEKRLEELVGYVKGERSREAQEIHTYLGFIHVAFGRTEEALKSFERALEIKPDLTLSAPSPKIAKVFEQARQRHRAKLRALDHDPPRLRHQPVRSIRYHSSVLVAASASDPSGLQRVVLNYRIAGNRGYSSVNMERNKAGFIATIPSISVVRPGVEYYIEAWDALGNGPGLKGSAAAPIRVTVEGGPLAAPSAPTAQPWYKKWWVWALAASAVLAAGGVGTAIYLGRDQRARMDLRWDTGELNP